MDKKKKKKKEENSFYLSQMFIWVQLCPLDFQMH